MTRVVRSRLMFYRQNSSLVLTTLVSIRSSPQVVVGDLGLVEMADAHVRLQKKLRSSDHDVQVCTPNYRAPEVTLGSQHFETGLDVWSFGCVAAEIYSRQPLIFPAAPTAEQAPSGKYFVDAIAAIVGRPGQGADVDVMPVCAASWLDELPFFKK